MYNIRTRFKALCHNSVLKQVSSNLHSQLTLFWKYFYELRAKRRAIWAMISKLNITTLHLDPPWLGAEGMGCRTLLACALGGTMQTREGASALLLVVLF